MAKKTYIEYILRKENTKAYSYILQDEYEYNKSSHIIMYPVNKEYANTEHTFNTDQDSRGEIM